MTPGSSNSSTHPRSNIDSDASDSDGPIPLDSFEFDDQLYISSHDKVDDTDLLNNENDLRSIVLSNLIKPTKIGHR